MASPLISVITPSIRPDGIISVKACLEEQTFKDFEHIIKLSEPIEPLKIRDFILNNYSEKIYAEKLKKGIESIC